MAEKKITVVVAEDVGILRENLCEMLEKSGDITVVASCETGRDAVFSCDKLHPDIAL